MKAADMARSAHQQALAAAEQERLLQEERRIEEQRQKDAEHQREFEAALLILNEWFPGVEWEWEQGGDYGHDTLVYDASEDWPPSFKLLVEQKRIVHPDRPDTHRPVLRIGDYVQDSSMPGYSYFSGSEVRSAADIGRYLARREMKKS